MNLRDLERAARLNPGEPVHAVVLALVEVAEAARAHVARPHRPAPFARLRDTLASLANLETP